MLRSGHHIKCHGKSWFKSFKSFSATPAPIPMTTYLGCQYFKRCHEDQPHQYPSLFPYFITIVCPPLYGWVPPLPSFFRSTISLTWVFWTFHNLFWFFIHFGLSRRMGGNILEREKLKSSPHTCELFRGMNSTLSLMDEVATLQLSPHSLLWAPMCSSVNEQLTKPITCFQYLVDFFFKKKIEKVNLLYSEFIIPQSKQEFSLCIFLFFWKLFTGLICG